MLSRPDGRPVRACSSLPSLVIASMQGTPGHFLYSLLYWRPKLNRVFACMLQRSRNVGSILLNFYGWRSVASK